MAIKLVPSFLHFPFSLLVSSEVSHNLEHPLPVVHSLNTAMKGNFLKYRRGRVTPLIKMIE